MKLNGRDVCTRSEFCFHLSKKHQGACNRTADDGPSCNAHSLASNASRRRACGITGSGRSIRQSAVDENCRCAVDIVDLYERLVQR